MKTKGSLSKRRIPFTVPEPAEPLATTHDELVACTIEVRQQLVADTVGRWFARSLLPRYMRWRGAFMTWAEVRFLAPHPHSARTGSSECLVCGMYRRWSADLERASRREIYELRKADSYQFNGLVGAYIELELSLLDPPPEDEPIDYTPLKRALDALRHCDADITPAKARALLKGIVPADARWAVIESLGAAGILSARNHPSPFDRFITSEEAAANKQRARTDSPYPFQYWRGSDGVREDAVKFYFPDL